ncbi:MAG TPA: SPOR domain-containing protein [Bacillus sp. (in: firmicutes)]|uniref:SPOR domain-containing protein n=1 Tax=Bacillus litorisediminis TaxID=2922713 RepID=UPI001FAF9EB3|nr:SPOR domain-containing protein [Bacillus litorisediminis]HWO77783.1 SPOR domain-containing protein [Bacillus sp. (in: firmicutes)]
MVDNQSPSTTSNTKRYRLVTGTFSNAETFAEALNRVRNAYNWIIYEKAESTNLNPSYRIVTGTFDSIDAAEEAAQQLRDRFGWTVYIQGE